MPAPSQDSQNVSQSVSSSDQRPVPVEQLEQQAPPDAAANCASSSTGAPLETDGGFVVGTESFANMNEIPITPKSQGGVSSRSYQNTATANDGAISIDLHLTLIDTFDQNGNLTTGTADQLPVTFSDFEGGPILLARNIGSSVAGYQGHTADIKVEFFDNTTGAAISVVGDFTFRDIDFIAPQSTDAGAGAEAVTAVSDQIQSCQVSADPATDIITQADNDGTIRFTNSSTCGGLDDQQRWVGIRFHETTSLNLKFQARNANTGYGLTTGQFSATPISFSPLQAQDDPAKNQALADDQETAITRGSVDVVVVAADEADGEAGAVNEVNSDLENSAEALTVSAVSGGTVGVAHSGNYGEIIINSDGTYRYTLDSSFPEVVALQAGQTLAETFDYTVSDHAGGFSSATLTITIAGANLPPVVGGTLPPQLDNDSDTIATLDVSRYFSNSENQPLTFSANGLPPGLEIDSLTGKITGQLDDCASQHVGGGVFMVEVTATAPNGESVKTTFDWKVTNAALVPENVWLAKDEDPAKAPPLVTTAIPDQTHFDSDTISADISGNFRDPNAKPLLFSAAGLPAGLSIDQAGNITGTIDSDASQAGPYSVVIRAQAENGASVSDTFTWNVTQSASSTVQGGDLATNDSPVVNTNIPDQNNLDSDTIDVDISPNFTSGDNSGLRFSATGLPHGLSIDVEGNISGTIDSNASQNGSFEVVIKAEDVNGFIATDTFTWEVGKPAPTSDPNDNVKGQADAGVAIVGSFGTTQVNSNGSFTYAIDSYNPAVKSLDAGETLTETFQCTVEDGEGGTSTAELRIVINGVGVTDLKNELVKFALFTAAPTNGMVVANADGSVTYTPNPNFDRTDCFEYEVCDKARNCDAVVNVGITQVDASGKIGHDNAVTGSRLGGDVEVKEGRVGITEIDGVAVNAGQTVTLPSGGAVTLNLDGTVSYNPNGEFEDLSEHAAFDTFTYTITDSSGQTSVAESVIMINGENDIPVAQDDFVTTTLNTPVTLDVTGNDIARQASGKSLDSPSGGPLHVILLNQPSDGTAVVEPNGKILFMPNSDFQGTTTIHYLIEDSNGSSTDATVTIEVEPEFQFDSYNKFPKPNSAGKVAAMLNPA